MPATGYWIWWEEVDRTASLSVLSVKTSPPSPAISGSVSHVLHQSLLGWSLGWGSMEEEYGVLGLSFRI